MEKLNKEQKTYIELIKEGKMDVNLAILRELKHEVFGAAMLYFDLQRMCLDVVEITPDNVPIAADVERKLYEVEEFVTNREALVLALTRKASTISDWLAGKDNDYYSIRPLVEEQELIRVTFTAQDFSLEEHTLSIISGETFLCIIKECASNKEYLLRFERQGLSLVLREWNLMLQTGDNSNETIYEEIPCVIRFIEQHNVTVDFDWL